MPPKGSRHNPFVDALAAAETKLAKALEKRMELSKKLGAVNAEIPLLQETISVLRQQLGEKQGRASHPVIPSETFFSPEVLKTLPPDDMSKFGSHQPTEDELLPEPPGVSLTDE